MRTYLKHIFCNKTNQNKLQPRAKINYILQSSKIKEKNLQRVDKECQSCKEGTIQSLQQTCRKKTLHING
jgi:signal recognition particle receptor subunit beta